MEPVYKANDGETFDTAEDCERHNNFLEARRAFLDAFDRMKVLAAKELKTADGEYLDIGGLRDFYYVKGEYALYPTIAYLELYKRGFDVRQTKLQKGEQPPR